MPIIDSHTHLMPDERTINGMRWMQKLKNSSTLLFDAEIDINLTSERAHQMLIDAGVDYYCPPRGLGEKPSPLGEDFSMLAVWNTIVNPAIPFMI